MFSIEELSIIKLYCEDIPNRNKILGEMNDSMHHIEEPDIKDTCMSAVRKLKALSDDEFKALSFADVLVVEDVNAD